MVEYDKEGGGTLKAIIIWPFTLMTNTPPCMRIRHHIVGMMNSHGKDLEKSIQILKNMKRNLVRAYDLQGRSVSFTSLLRFLYILQYFLVDPTSP
jgi:hypothetical protein